MGILDGLVATLATIPGGLGAGLVGLGLGFGGSLRFALNKKINCRQLVRF